jgi:hypothetical protein
MEAVFGSIAFPEINFFPWQQFFFQAPLNNLKKIFPGKAP